MRNLLIMMAVILTLTQLIFAKEWNGIKPLLTTRAEVIKMLGEPKPLVRDDLNNGERFEFDEQPVYIRWAIADCRKEGEKELKVLDDSPPAGLSVVAYQITVMPRVPLALEDIEKMNLPTISSTHPPFGAWGGASCLGSGGKWSCSRVNTEAGLGYTTSTDKSVVRLYYVPSDRELLTWQKNVPLCSDGKK